jgi:hypothetical protein
MQHEPFGFPALDLWHGLRCAVSIAPHLKQGAKADPRDYMISRPPEPEMTPEQTVACFRSLLGGKTKKKE